MAGLGILEDRGLQEKPGVIKRLRIRFSGIVQGVGFRPFVYRTANAFGISGFVRNDSGGVTVEAQAEDDSVDAFLASLLANTPPLAEIYDVKTETIPPAQDAGFRIIPSDANGRPSVLISPDVATCDACLRELFDPSDRRYRYPLHQLHRLRTQAHYHPGCPL